MWATSQRAKGPFSQSVPHISRRAAAAACSASAGGIAGGLSGMTRSLGRLSHSSREGSLGASPPPAGPTVGAGGGTGLGAGGGLTRPRAAQQPASVGSKVTDASSVHARAAARRRPSARKWTRTMVSVARGTVMASPGPPSRRAPPPPVVVGYCRCGSVAASGNDACRCCQAMFVWWCS